jgi:glutathionylspermidine synthase
MQRIPILPRNKWQQAVENIGFGFHSTDVPYWNEAAYYSFSIQEIEQIEKATQTLWQLSLQAVQHVIDNNLYHVFAIPNKAIPLIEQSWNNDEPSIYGRFDLCVKNNEIKLLEFNADTPTSLFEAGIVQWFWLQDFNKQADQFNSIHEKLIGYFTYLKNYLHAGKLHFTCVKESLEDLTNTEYIRDCAMQAGIDTELVFINDIGWNTESNCFVDTADKPISNIFKLYPWEWLLAEAFSKELHKTLNTLYWIEPAWKMLLSNKAILAILWELFPNHPLLLPTYFNQNSLTQYAKKPLLSREGANIQLVSNAISLQTTEGLYGSEGYVYQQLCTLPNFSNQYAVVGSWIIGQEAAGIGIRESNNLITTNTSCFVPHVIE